MAELGPEGLDDFQDRIDELGDYLFTTLLNSIEGVAQSANLDNLGKSLTTELTKGLNEVQIDKIVSDKLLKNTKVDSVLAKVQKKFEDGVSKISFKINSIELPTKPLAIDVKASKLDTSALDKFISIPVEYSYDKLTIPTQNIDVGVGYLYDKFSLPIKESEKSIQVPVNYLYSKFSLPSVKKIDVPVSYVYDKYTQPKAAEISVPVSYNYDKFTLPKVNPIDVFVDYVYTKFELPKAQQITIPVAFDYAKFGLPKAGSIDVAVEYIYDKFQLPKAVPVKVPVSFIYDKFALPKANMITVPVSYDYEEYTQPGVEDITVPVSYDYDKLILPKSQVVDVFVDFVYDKLQIPKIKPIDVNVQYAYDKLKLPTIKDIKVAISYVYDKLKLPTIGPINVPIKYIYDVFKAPLIESIKVPATVSSINTDLINKTLSAIQPVNTTVTDLGSINTLTSGISSAGDAARDFVNYLTEANKKANITLDLYNKIKNAAEDLVKASKLDESGMNRILDSLQSKLKQTEKIKLDVDTSGLDDAVAKKAKIKNIKLKATLSEVDTSYLNELIGKITPIKLSSILNVDESQLEKLKSDFIVVDTILQVADKTELEKLQNTVIPLQASVGATPTTQQTITPTFNLTEFTKNIKSAFIDAAVELNRLGLSFGTAAGDSLQRGVNRIRPAKVFDIDGSGLIDMASELLDTIKQTRTESALIAKNIESEASLIQFKLNLQKQLQNSTFEEKANLISKLGIQVSSGMTEKQINAAIVTRLAALQKQQILQDNIKNAGEDYSTAVRQTNADALIKQLVVKFNITEQETAELMLQHQLAGTLTDDLIKQIQLKDKSLRHSREEIELIEHVAEYQREVNKELEEFTSKWSKFKATISSILSNPAFAKATLFASGIVMAEKLTHSMHEFKEAGMDAGTAVQATFKGLTFNSLLGLSDTQGVLKSITQQFGTINALTKDQVDAVGKMAKSNGLATDEAVNLAMAVSRMPGQTRETASNSEAMFKSIAKTKGVIPAQVMKEVAKNSGLMATYSKGGAEGFIRAAAAAKKMGVELGTILNAARKTLDFESSINAEMEASVMLGRSLNTDALRRAALSGDAEAIQREQVRLIQQAGGLDRMNVLQKEKLADLMGMSVEDMQKINDSARYQEKHFGEQASTWATITGYTVKYSEGLISGFTSIAPLLTGMASLMSLMNATSLKGLVSNTWSMVKGLAAGVLQAGLLLVKFIAMGAVRFWGMLKGLPSMIGSASAAAKGLSFKGAVDGLKEVGSRLKDFIKEASSGKVKDAFSSVFKKKEVALGPELPKPEQTGGAGPLDQANKVSKLNAGALLKGAAAMLVAAASTFVFAKAIQELEKVKDWKSVAIGLGLFAISMAATAGILALAGPKIAIASLALIPFGLALMMFAKAIDIAAPAITMLGAAFGSFVETVSKNLTGFIAVALGLPLLAAGITALGIASIFALPAAGALTILGVGIAAFGKLVGVAAPSITAVATSLIGLSKVDTSSFDTIGDGLLHIAKGLGAIGLSGLVAIPVLAALSKLGMTAPQEPVTPREISPKSTAPSVKATQPTTATIQAPAAATKQSAESQAATTTKVAKESNQDISILVDKLSELIVAMKSGATINVDGRVLANVVQSNIRSLKFND